jgi:hypothetical protein
LVSGKSEDSEQELMDAIEVLKAIGLLPGIFAVGFLVRDRFVKHFPLAIFVARPLMPGSQNVVPFLFIKNVSDRPILVTSERGGPSEFTIARDQTLRGVITSIVADKVIVVVDAGGEAYLPVFKPKAFAEIDPWNMMELSLRWRFAQPVLWRPDRNLRVSIKKADFELMIENYMPPAKDSTTG